MAASNATWLNSCVNPIVYAMMNTRFRKGNLLFFNQAIKNHLKEEIGRLKGETHFIA